MKTVLNATTTFLILLTSIVAASQSIREYDLENYDALKIEGPYTVKVASGAPYIRLDGDEEVIERTSVKIVRGELIISYDGMRWGAMSDRIDVLIQFEEIESLQVSGACDISFEDTIESENFDLGVSGASKLDAVINASEVRTDISGASTINLSGRTNRLDIELSGASKLNAEDLSSLICNIDCSGASTATVSVTERLRAEASGASTVRYYGNPEYVNTDASGAASIRKR